MTERDESTSEETLDPVASFDLRPSGTVGMTIAQAIAAMDARDISSVELVQAHLARIDELQPVLNAWTTVAAGRALEDAARADRRRSDGGEHSPILGIPMGLKDLFATRGIRTTAGSAVLKDWIPDEDSAVASILGTAGAPLLGKQSTHEFAWGGTTNNHHFGPTRNPWDASRIPGGSSGGSAVAVTTGMSMGAVGTDTCGSVRIPASLSGCVGLKPTYGLISLRGVVPLSPSLDHAGPLARTVRDAAVLLEVLAGHDAGDPRSLASRHVDYSTHLTGEVRGTRVGVLRGRHWSSLSDEVGTALSRALAVLRSLGCDTRDLEVALPDSFVADVFDLVHTEASTYHSAISSPRSEYGPEIQALLARHPSGPDEAAARNRRLCAAAYDIVTSLRGVDVLACATMAITAPMIGAERVDVAGQNMHIEVALTRLTSLFDVAGLPALSVPCESSSDSLPTGLQLVGRRLDEAVILRLGDAYQRATGQV